MRLSLFAISRPRSSFALPALAAALASVTLGCVSMLGRADDALARGDYREAADLYGRLLARDPDDPIAQARLTDAERRLVDRAFDRVDAARFARDDAAALDAGLAALATREAVHAEAIDGPRAARTAALFDWARAAVRASIQEDTTRGRALAARARRASSPPVTAWLAQPELASLGPELDEEIAAAGARTCARATSAAGEQSFTLELVAAYCKAVGAPLPPWRPRPLLVGGATLEGTIAGTPDEERAELERAVSDAVARSVWFTSTSTLRAIARVDGSVSSLFTDQPTELARSWTASVPYEAHEPYKAKVDVPFVATEKYSERVPFTAYEDGFEPCPPPRVGRCKVSRPVTRYRDEVREREVPRVRTEERELTRKVTRYRDEPRVFRFPATKREGRYEASFGVSVELGPGLRPIEARAASEDSRVVYEHDAEFAPAGVRPERGTLPSAVEWRREQRDRLRAELLHALDAGWTQAFCGDAVVSVEDAARCAHARPHAVPAAVRSSVEELFGDDPDLVLALPRPGETVSAE